MQGGYRNGNHKNNRNSPNSSSTNHNNKTIQTRICNLHITNCKHTDNGTLHGQTIRHNNLHKRLFKKNKSEVKNS